MQLLYFVLQFFAQLKSFLYFASWYRPVRSELIETLLVEPLAAAVCDLPTTTGVSATNFLASGNDTCFSTLTGRTIFSNFQASLSCKCAKWFPIQFMQEMSFVIGWLPWSNWPQHGYVNMLRHVVWLWPNLWHLKHHNGFGTIGTTGIERYPALIYYARVGLLNVRISVFIGIKLSSWWILILFTAVTPCGERFSINQ